MKARTWDQASFFIEGPLDDNKLGRIRSENLEKDKNLRSLLSALVKTRTILELALSLSAILMFRT